MPQQVIRSIRDFQMSQPPLAGINLYYVYSSVDLSPCSSIFAVSNILNQEDGS